MRALITYLAACACALGVARAEISAAAPSSSHAAPNQEAQDLLSGIDFVPDKGILDDTFTDARSELNEIATDASLDSGVRIRAIWALGQYPGGPTEATLIALISGLEPIAEGTGVIMLRAAIYSLSEIAPVNAVSVIGPLLAHVSRDVRTDAAHGLAKTKQFSAIPMLRERLNEPGETEQVRWALAEAIRTLSDLQEL